MTSYSNEFQFQFFSSYYLESQSNAQDGTCVLVRGVAAETKDHLPFWELGLWTAGTDQGTVDSSL